MRINVSTACVITFFFPTTLRTFDFIQFRIEFLYITKHEETLNIRNRMETGRPNTRSISFFLDVKIKRIRIKIFGVTTPQERSFDVKDLLLGCIWYML